jgi:hypothetical protein
MDANDWSIRIESLPKIVDDPHNMGLWGQIAVEDTSAILDAHRCPDRLAQILPLKGQILPLNGFFRVANAAC